MTTEEIYPGPSQGFRSHSEQGTFAFCPETYGKSFLGAPLLYFPPLARCQTLLIAGVHGEESDTTFLLSRALRLLDNRPPHTATILCANPDGMSLGTRGNARGVDLNRNWPSKNWNPSPTLSRLVLKALAKPGCLLVANLRANLKRNACLT